jgi:hypothetical protein
MTAPALAVYVNGPVAVSGDNLNTFAQTCDTSANLRAFIGTIGQTVDARGIAAVNDGLGGAFYWNSASTSPDDNLTIIVPSGASVGAWVRLTLGQINNNNAQLLYQEIYPGVTFADNVTGYQTNAPGNTQVQRAAVAGYMKNTNPVSGITQNGVALFGCGTAEVNNAATWGINTLLQDASSRTVGTGTGRILLNEFDFNVMNPATQVIGLSIGGNSLAQPTTANCFIVNSLGTGITWGGGFVTEDGAAITAVSIGASSATVGPNYASQKLSFSFYDDTSTKDAISLQATSPGTGSPAAILALTGPVPTSFDVVNGNVNIVTGVYTNNSVQVVGTRVTGWGAATNGSTAAFNGSTATLAQTSAALAAVIIALTTHGLIGP